LKDIIGWLKDFNWEEWVTHPLVAAAGGSAISAFKAFPGSTWAVKFWNFVVGMFMALVPGLALADALGIESRRIFAAVVLLLGLGGVLLSNMAIEWWQQAKMADLPLIGKFFKKQGQETP
jgi:uncharacterized membrane protein YdjX (TVP38/TMEM64 family)